MLDIYTFRSNLWEQANDRTPLEIKTNSLFNWLERNLTNCTNNAKIINGIIGFKESFLSLNEALSTDSLYQVEDELVDKIDEIIEKMIYAVYAELQKLQTAYKEPAYENMPGYDYNIPPDYYQHLYPSPRKRRHNRSWIEKMFDSVKPYGDLITEEGAHPVIKIVQMLSRFGNEAKKLVRQHIRKINQEIGVPSQPTQNNPLKSYSFSTDDLRGANPGFAKPMASPASPMAPATQSTPNTSPVSPVAAASPIAASTPIASQEKPSGGVSAVTAPLRDPRQSIEKPLPVDKPVVPKDPTENQRILDKIAGDIKQIKDEKDFMAELLKFRRPTAKLAALVKRITGTPFTKNTNEKSLMDKALDWHRQNQGATNFVQKHSPVPTEQPVVAPTAPNKIEPPKVELPGKIEPPKANMVPPPEVKPEIKKGLSSLFDKEDKKAEPKIEPSQPIKPKSPEEVKATLDKAKVINPSIIFASALEKAMKEVPDFDDYDLHDLSKAYTKSVGDTAKETENNFVSLLKSGKVQKKKINEPMPEPEPKKPEEPEVNSIDDLFGTSTTAEPHGDEPESKSDDITPIAPLEPDTGEYHKMGRQFGGHHSDTPVDEEKRKRALARLAKMGLTPKEWSEMNISEKILYAKEFLKEGMIYLHKETILRDQTIEEKIEHYKKMLRS